MSKLLTRESLTSTTALLAYLALADFVFHTLFATDYGYFRDELYYIVSGTQHLSLGYVDFPPFIAYVAALLNVFTGDSLFSIHVVPALCEAVLVFLAGMIARELGGGREAQLLAGVATLLSLGFLAVGSLFSPDPFDDLWWSLLAYVTIRAVRRGEPRLWVAAGVVVGLGLLTKLTMFFFAAALLFSFLAYPSAWRHLRSRWILAGAFISFAFIVPMLYWNAVNGWPMVQFYESFRGDVGGGGPVSFFFAQLGDISYLNLPIVVAGLYFYLRSKDGRDLRPLGLAFVLLYAFMTALNFKSYYLLPVYPMLFAAGALVVERSSISKRGVSRWFGSRPYIACTLLVTALLVPVVMPILSPPALIGTYGASTLASANGNVASGESGPLPQNLGDRLGWGAMVTSVAQAYQTLTPGEKSQACIFTANYGEASALIFLGKGLGLPPVISGHNNYYVWGPGSCTGQVLITVGIPLNDDLGAYARASLLTTIKCQYCMDLENNVPVYLCVGPRFNYIASEWSVTKHYD